MSVPNPNKLTESLQQGRLTARDQAQWEAYLAEHPEQLALWEADLGLNQLLQQLPDAPISSNFTAQVVQAISSERAPTAAFQKSLWSRVLARHWIPKLATGAALLFAGLLSYQQHQLASRRALALQVVELHEMTTTATIEVLQNFDAIQRLNQVARDPDHDLIAALK